MCKISGKNHSALSRIFYKINKEVSRFEEVEFFHMLREYNWQVDKLENEESRLDHGYFIEKNGLERLLIP